jgi:hypothetical protein
MLEMRLAKAVSAILYELPFHPIPVQIALRIQPGYTVPFGVASCCQFLVVCVDIALAVIGDGCELAVVLQLVL